MAAKVFISHSSADEKVASAICAALENRGLGCWIAGRDVGPGENFQEAIVKAIRAAKVMVLVFTENANNSHEIKKELVLAGQSNLVIIPARVENVAPNDAFAYEFATRQWVDLFKDWEREIERLSAWVAGILSIEPAVAPKPTPLTAHLIPSLGPPHATAPPGPTAPVKSTSPLSTNPVHHFVGAFLLVLGAFLVVFLVSSFVDDFGTEPVKPVRPSAIALGLAVSLIVVAAAIAAGLGTIRRRNWARLLGLGLCAGGLLVAVFWMSVDIKNAIRELHNAYNEWNRATNVPIAIPFTDVFHAGLCSLFALSFVGAGAIYLWGWHGPLMPDPKAPRKTKMIALVHRNTVFAMFIVFICILTSGAFYLYWLDLGRSKLLWNAILVALDALVFAYCYVRFHKEFDSIRAVQVQR